MERGVALKLKSVLTTAENLTPNYRCRIERAFSTKVFDEYGGEDMSFMAQCEQGGLYHANAENVFVELLKDGQRVAAGEEGEVVVTDLTRQAMPFIRYAMGDAAVNSSRACPCGRGLPTFERVVGRIGAVFTGDSGRKIPATGVGHAFDLAEIKYYQVIQREQGMLVARVVPDRGFDARTEEQIMEVLTTCVGDDFRCRLDLVDDIPRTAAGKFRMFVSELDDE